MPYTFSYYFLIPSSNKNNLIYLRSSEWGKHDKQQQISSSRVVLSFVFYQDFLFLHHLTSETNNKALIQRTSQYFDMIHVIAALSYFLVTLSWNETYIVATLSYFPAALSWNMTHIAATLNYFPAALSWNMTHIVAALNYFPATLSWNITHIVAALSGYLELQAIVLVIASLS